MNTLEENKLLVTELIRAVWNEQRPDALAEYHGQDFVNHSVPLGMDPGWAGLVTSVELFRTAFSELRITVSEQVAEQDRVASVVHFSGRHTGTFLGVAPTGREVSMGGLRMDRVWEGKVREHWASFDLAGLLQQLR